MNSWFVYILQCADGSYYTGITVDLDARTQAHNQKKTGAKYTRARRPVSLVYAESLDSRSQAQKREIAIKRLTRAQKISLISGTRLKF